MNIEKTLQEIGLQEREIKVYLALLELGESTVLPIAKKANLKRTYCYDILDELGKKSLVSYLEKNGRRRYVAEDPKKIEIILQERLNRFSDLLPELRSIYNKASSKPKVRFYEGIEEVRAIYEEITVNDFDCLYSAKPIYDIWGPTYSTELGKRVAANKVRARELIVTNEPVPYEKYFRKPTNEVRYLPPQTKLQTDIIIFKDRIALVSYDKDIHTIVIENSAIVEAQRSMFELIWNATPSTQAQ